MTNGAYDFEYFSINNDDFLAVANYYNDETCYIDSFIFKWDDDTKVFVKYQDIPTTGATDWKYFTILDKRFLANANYEDGSTHNLLSTIYLIVE